ncbi:poly(glycerol-phosphate) alpha-glucosyltransferase [Exiguobacterium artemiae]|uniref:poly(glycerol-phosphate) alpha-glucosyltransferase n=1 Tax=Exiguobacterium artemiae TaxID=340145 RepID=UPI002964D54C|nr:poly(glycerol-phosphate) alpha-glucosyltransferase [Exiguobacterium sibiricum]MDW2886744.1 poly(glycerol-phosphate) alpha-glucosyltransferase [Exiguobacterium sibiricum]
MDQLMRIEALEKKLIELMEQESSVYYLNQRLTVFVSLGNPFERAQVHTFRGKRLSTIFQKIKMHLLERPNRYEWIKIDLAKNFQICTFEELNERVEQTRKNYFRHGLAFDMKMQCAFLEEELNGNAMLTQDPDHPELRINLKNMTRYVELQKRSVPQMTFHPQMRCIVFETISLFEEEVPVRLRTSLPAEKIREYPNQHSLNSEITSVVRQASHYLAEQVQTNGRFIYGYFPCFDKKISFYNSLRHASTLYSMIEAYEITPDKVLRQAIDRAKFYLINELIVTKKDRAYVVDWESNEVKLGANATALLALTQYMKTFQTQDDLELCRQLATVILELQQEDGHFQHVLAYPELTVKEAFRIVYYEGEAAFALLRLYEQDRDERFLTSVIRAFDYFLEREYWKYHDHWLSYSINELTKYRPEDRYYMFGLQNVAPKLNFIHDRETTYPTFLELMLAARQMIGRMHDQGRGELLNDFPSKQLEATIERRMHYQLNGFFYPEVAMYMKRPERILGSFYIRHHSFRVRIDDVEHNLSGYCQVLRSNREEVGMP